jgi:serine/threonine protein kinase
VKRIGRGSFGVVILATTSTGEKVAIKKVKQDFRIKEREWEILSSLDHPNCISLKHAFKSQLQGKPGVFYNFVMEYMPMNLATYADSFRRKSLYPPISIVKLLIFQLFAGLKHLHMKGICHRDIKPHNLLVDPSTGVLKICDFGSAKYLTDGMSSTSYIGSRYYRAPELLFNCTQYTSAIDIWSAGCCLAEALMGGVPLFPGGSALGQLAEIVKVIGPPSQDDMAALAPSAPDSATSLPLIRYAKQQSPLRSIVPRSLGDEVKDLFAKVFVYDPKVRLSAEGCMLHSCFDELFERQHILPNGRPFPRFERK